MKLYYTLTCVVLPAAMIAACSGSGEKKPTTTDVASNIQVIQVENNHEEMKHEIPKQEVAVSETTAVDSEPEVVESEAEKFPLAAETEQAVVIPTKRIYQFGFNKQEISDTDQESLQEHADYLLAHPNATLAVNGHTDTQGQQAYNQFLSKERAKIVAGLLVEYGAPETQIKVNGLGDSQPLNDVNNYKENRRVELQYSDSRVAIK